MTAGQGDAVLHTGDVTMDDLRGLVEFVRARIGQEVAAHGRRELGGEPVAEALIGMLNTTRDQAVHCLHVLEGADADPVRRVAALVQLDNAWTALCAAAGRWSAEPGFDAARWRRPPGGFPGRLGTVEWAPPED